MNGKYKFSFKEIPIEKIQMDKNQPRTNYGTDGDENRLLVSIRELGLQTPLKVMENGDNYLLIDGHRRYLCAKKIGFKKMPCIVEPKMSEGEIELMRYETQNNRRDWKPIERSEAFHRIKEQFRYKNKDLAHLFHLAESVISDILSLKTLNLRYLTLMTEYDLDPAYQSEFTRLYPKLRKVGSFEIEEIIQNIFERVKRKTIKTSKDFRRLGRIFKRAAANEHELEAFLKNPDMTVSELVGHTEQSGFSGITADLINWIAKKRKDGKAFTSKEKGIMDQLMKVWKEAR